MHRACRPEATWFLGACTTFLLDIMSTQGRSITLSNTIHSGCASPTADLSLRRCRTSWLSNTHTRAKLLYYILNHRSIISPGEEHLVCLVTNLGLRIEAIMASWVLHGTHIPTTFNFSLIISTFHTWLHCNLIIRLLKAQINTCLNTNCVPLNHPTSCFLASDLKKIDRPKSPTWSSNS